MGGVISINGVKFVKVNLDGDFVAANIFVKPGFATGMYMQDFTSTMCAQAPTPMGTGYFFIGVLVDGRDNKQYEVRKFADGRCWMVDNLAYGGADLNNGVDGCLKTTFCGLGYDSDGNCITNGNKAVSTVDIVAPGFYGECCYPYASISTPDTNKYGYLYNWQAAMQDALAYRVSYYQPSQPTQGICPNGWHVPSGGDAGEFSTLQSVVGAGEFWSADGSYRGSYAGCFDCNNYTGLYSVGVNGRLWSSTQIGMHYA